MNTSVDSREPVRFKLASRMPVLSGDRLRVSLLNGRLHVSILHREKSMVGHDLVETVLLDESVPSFNQLEFEDKPSEYVAYDGARMRESTAIPMFASRPISDAKGPLGRRDVVEAVDYDRGYTYYVFSGVLRPDDSLGKDILLVEQLREMVFNFIILTTVVHEGFVLEDYIDSYASPVGDYYQRVYCNARLLTRERIGGFSGRC